MKKILIGNFVLISLFYNNITFSQTTTDQIISGPFKTDLYSNGKIYFEKTNNREKEINFVLEYNLNGKNKKDIVDYYPHSGAIPEIKSVFFDTIHNKKYIFVMVVWDAIHQGIGMRGSDYQTYAYTKNPKGILALDKTLSKGTNLSGFDGENDCKNDVNPDGIIDCEMHYKYKTAAEVKKYLKQKYH